MKKKNINLKYSLFIYIFSLGILIVLINSLLLYFFSTSYLLHILATIFVLLIITYLFSLDINQCIKRYTNNLLFDEDTDVKNRIDLEYRLNHKKFENCIVILLNIKNFRKLQSAYGYATRNNVLKECAKLLKEFKKNEKNFKNLYLYDNNTFAIKYFFEDEEKLDTFARNLSQLLENHEIIIKDNITIFLDLIIACSNTKKIHNSIEKLHEAEMALDFAKDNKLCFFIFDYQNNNDEVNKTNLHISKIIKNAIETKNIELHYQGIYNNRTQKIEKYETLMRIKSKTKIYYPNSFLEIAKDSQKYNLLTCLMIEKAFEKFQNNSYDFSINLSVIDISKKEFIDFLEEKIDKYNVKDKLVIELVESESITNFETIKEFMEKMKQKGVRIAIDDFGSGYSNFEHIISLSQYIDYVKIDGSLIKNIHKNRKSQLLIGILKFLCDSLHIKTIAEFVEDKETFDFVDSMGINYSQGYHISKPNAKLIN